MKRLLAAFIGLIVFSAISCKKDNPDSDEPAKTSFDIGSTNYKSSETILYLTDFGQLLMVNGADFELCMILSDAANNTFSITDTLTGAVNGKARCILKLANQIKFSVSGTINYDSGNKTGSFQVIMEDLNLQNGEIHVDSTVNNPVIDFTSLTETDYQGFPINSGDENDWNIRTDWELEERIIFNLKPQNSSFDDLQLVVYPNPFGETFQMPLDIAEGQQMDLFVVNQNFEIETTFVKLQPGNHAFLLDDPDFKGNYYRFYYKIYNGTDQYYGSGDVKVNN